ncbi:MAG: hypothetical protein ACOY3C_00925 [Bacillota bacterium]
MDRERMKPVAAGISFAVLFGLSFIYTKGALDYVDPYRFIGFRFALEPVAQTSGGAEEETGKSPEARSEESPERYTAVKESP